jgi:hypothetical protein
VAQYKKMGEKMGEKNGKHLDNNKHYDDTLFWCIYNHMCNINPDKYNTFGLQLLNAQIQEKTHIIEWIKSNIKRFQTALTDHRITKGKVEEIMTMLLTGANNNLNCLMAYVAYYGVNVIIWYPDNHSYCKFTPLTNGDNNENIVLKYCNGNKWKMADNGEFNCDECIKMKYFIGEGTKCLGNESLYKKEELMKMAKIIGIDIGEKMGKKELYDKINISCYIIK